MFVHLYNEALIKLQSVKKSETIVFWDVNPYPCATCIEDAVTLTNESKPSEKKNDAQVKIASVPPSFLGGVQKNTTIFPWSSSTY